MSKSIAATICNGVSLVLFALYVKLFKKLGDHVRVPALVGLQFVQKLSSFIPGFISCASSIDKICELVANPPEYMYQDGKENAEKCILVPYDEYLQTKEDFCVGSSPFERDTTTEWRHMDGGGNNPTKPWLGQGCRGMALRFPKRPLPDNLPDAKTLVEDFCIRPDDDASFTPCANGVNSLTPYFALCVIHDFFRSDTGRSKVGKLDRPWVNLHSSYLDLQTVYGYNKKSCASVRTQKHGKLTEKKIVDHRLERMAVCHALILVMVKHHNFICDQLMERYPDKFKTDEMIFQTARLINCGVYINLIIELYSCGLFHVWNEDGSNPVELRGLDYPRDIQGYHLSYEFNIMYRFHAFIPKEWTPFYGLSKEAIAYLKKGDFTHSVPALSDDAIKTLLVDAMSHRAGANHVPSNVPRVMGPAEVKGIEDARLLGISTYNDFKEAVGEPKYDTFLDMSGNRPELAAKLEKHYPTVDDVEFAVGMRVETRTPLRGAGFSNTVGRAILADAFSSIRFDRFYSQSEYHAGKYTEWGLAHTKSTHMRDLLKLHLDVDIPLGYPLCIAPDAPEMPAKFRKEKA